MSEQAFPSELSPSDTLMWRIEADPVLRSPILVVGLLDRAPAPDDLTASLERAARALPRLRQFIEPAPLSFGPPRWRDDDRFSVEHHVRRVRAASGAGGLDAALAVAEPDVAAAFDPARPPWTLTLVEGLDDDAAALVLRFHHAITDGVGGIEIADLLFDRSRRAPRRSRRATAPPPAPRTPGLPQRAVAALGGLAGGALATVTHPRAALGAPARVARSALRVLAPPAAAGSPLLAGRSLDRSLAVTERPLRRLKAAAAAAGGTVNDVLLAAVAGALATYHRKQGHPVPAARVTMPISVRRPGDDLGGNRFVPARFTLPVDDPDPAVRARIAGNIVRRWRAEPALDASNLLAAGLNLLPRPVVARVFGDLLRSMDVDVVDLPGLARPAYLAGARIERLWAFAPPVGAALSITLVSHRRTACIGLSCDTAAVTDPPLLAACLDDALDEVVALARGAR